MQDEQEKLLPWLSLLMASVVALMATRSATGRLARDPLPSVGRNVGAGRMVSSSPVVVGPLVMLSGIISRAHRNTKFKEGPSYLRCGLGLTNLNPSDFPLAARGDAVGLRARLSAVS